MEKNTEKDKTYGIEFYEYVNNFRNNSSEFDSFISEINSEFKKFTSKRKNYDDIFLFKRKLNIVIPTSLVLTNEQKTTLCQYIYDKYIDVVPGDLFIIRKCHFIKGYRIRSLYINKLFNIACSLLLS